jgi:hypothetical protein
MKLISRTNKESYGCCLQFNGFRRCYFVFDHDDSWYCDLLSGYTHVSYAQPIDHFGKPCVIMTEPYNFAAETQIVAESDFLHQLAGAGKMIVEVKYLVTRKNRLIRPVLQTCSTLTQYLAGITLGAITAQGLYNKLTKSKDSWLRDRGIREVVIWEEAQDESLRTS